METHRVAVTGSSGFLGRYVVAALSKEGHEIIGIDLVESSTKVDDFRQCDFTSMAAAVEGLRGATVVCHLGGVGDVYLADTDPALAFRANAFGTKVVCDAASKLGIGGLVYASTWEVYGKPERKRVDESHPCNPQTPYSISKLAGELLARSSGARRELSVTILRLGTAYGPFMRDTTVIARFLKSALRTEPLTVHGSGTQSRQFTHASDIGRAFSRVVGHHHAGSVYNIVADEEISIGTLAEMIAAQFDVSITFTEARMGDPPTVYIVSQKARRQLGWKPEVAFAQGLKELVSAARLNAD